MDRHRLQAVWRLAEACYAQGQSLRAFLLLYSLLQNGCDEVSETGTSSKTKKTTSKPTAQPAFPPYLKRDEVATRVRAVEYLLYEPHTHTTAAALPPVQSTSSLPVHAPLSRAAQLEALTLAQELLDPLFASTPSSSSLLLLGADESAMLQDVMMNSNTGGATGSQIGALQRGISHGGQRQGKWAQLPPPQQRRSERAHTTRLSSLVAPRTSATSSLCAGNEYYFSAANVQGVVWQGNGFVLPLPPSLAINIDTTTSTTIDTPAASVIDVHEASACATVPVALLLRAYILRATLCLRRGQHRRALGFLHAAERWLLSTFREPQLSGTVRDLCEELRVRGQQRRRNDDVQESNTRTSGSEEDSGDAAWASALLVLPDALHAVLSYEKVYCEGLLAAAFCHVLHAWLASSHMLPSTDTPAPNNTPIHNMQTSEAACNGKSYNNASSSASRVHGVDFAQRQREYGEAIHLLGAYAAVYVSLSKATSPAQLWHSLTRIEETTTVNNTTRGRDSVLRALLTRLTLQHVHSACLTSRPAAGSLSSHTALCAGGFPLRAVAALLGFYHCIAGIYLLHHRPRISQEEQQHNNNGSSSSSTANGSMQHPAFPLRRHLARCVELFASNHDTNTELLRPEGTSAVTVSEWTLLERLYLLGPCEELAQLRPALLTQLHAFLSTDTRSSERSAACDAPTLPSLIPTDDIAGVTHKRPREDSTNNDDEEEDEAVAEGRVDDVLWQLPCWTSAGLRRVVSCLLVLWATTHGVAEATISMPIDTMNAQATSPLPVHVQRLFDTLMRELETEMLRLAGQQNTTLVTSDSTPCRATNNTKDSVVKSEDSSRAIAAAPPLMNTTSSNNSRSVTRGFAWHASAAAQTRFLIHVKAAGLFVMSTYALTQLRLVQAVRFTYELQQLMLLFRPRLNVWRTELHLLSACLAMSLSLRESAGVGRFASHPYGAHNENGTTILGDNTSSNSHEAALWRDVSRDVGLPYTHLIAAEHCALHSLRSSPATLHLVKLLKALAIYQVVAIGESMQLQSHSSGVQRTAAHTATLSPRMNANNSSTSQILAAHRIARLESVTSASATITPLVAEKSTTTTVVKEQSVSNSGARLISPRNQRTYRSSALPPQLLQLPPACTRQDTSNDSSAAADGITVNEIKTESSAEVAQEDKQTNVTTTTVNDVIDKTGHGECYVMHAMALSQRHRCAAALQLIMQELRESYERYTALHEPQQDSMTSEGSNNRSHGMASTQQAKQAECTLLTAWSTSNVILFTLLQGLVALSEDKDPQAAMQYFKTATHNAKQHLGTLHPFVADGLQWLACVAAAAESSPHAEDATRIALVAMHVALHANGTALWHLPPCACTGSDACSEVNASAPRTEIDKDTRIDHQKVKEPDATHHTSNDPLPRYVGALDVRCVWDDQCAQLAAAPAQLMAVVGMLPGTPAYARLGT